MYSINLSFLSLPKRTLLQVETTLAGDQACLYTLNNLCEDLKEGINTAMHEKEILYGKYRSIQDFKKLAVSI